MRLFATALTMFAIASIAWAQDVGPASEAEAIRLIEAADPTDIAWGAHAAAEKDWRGAIPALRDALRECGAPDAEVPDAAVLVVLDALIRLKATPSSADLLPWARRKGPHLGALLHIAVSKSMADVLLELYDHAEGRPTGDAEIWRSAHPWVAAGNALARSRTPGFAVRVLQHLRFELTISARDKGAPDEIPAKDESTYTSVSLLSVPEGYPSVPLYRIALSAGENGAPLVGGPTATVFLRRTEFAPGDHKVARKPFEVDWLASQVGWLAALIGKTPSELPIRARSTKTVAFESAENFRPKAGAIQDRMIAAYWTLVRKLIEKGVLSVAEAGVVGPQIAFYLKDDREATLRGFLPELPHPRLNCPFPLGEGPPPGSLPSEVRLAIENPSSVTAHPNSYDRRTKAEPDWATRFRFLVRGFDPETFTPSLPAFSPEYVVEFAGPRMVAVRVSLEHEHVAVLADGKKLPGYWSFRGGRNRVFALLVQLFPPNKDPDSWLGKLPGKYRDVLENPSRVGVYCCRVSKTRVPAEDWIRRFRETVGCPGASRYYMNLPPGLFKAEYEVIFDPPEGSTFPDNECIAFRICPRSGYIGMRRSDMGFGGFWSYVEERAKIIALLREVFPEDDRLK